MPMIVPEIFNYLRGLTDISRKKYPTESLEKVSIAVNAAALERALDFIEVQGQIKEVEKEGPAADLKKLKESLVTSGKVIIAADRLAALPLEYPSEKRKPYLEAYLNIRKEF